MVVSALMRNPASLVLDLDGISKLLNTVEGGVRA
jgi:hypothetical protein